MQNDTQGVASVDDVVVLARIRRCLENVMQSHPGLDDKLRQCKVYNMLDIKYNESKTDRNRRTGLWKSQKYLKV